MAKKKTAPVEVVRVPVSERAVFARLSRKLWSEKSLVLKRCKPTSRWFEELGRYYAVNAQSGVECTHQDLESWAREEGILRPFERVE